MQDARKHPRIRCRLPVDLFCGNESKRLNCRSQDLCLGGMFAAGAECMRVDDQVHVELAPESGAQVHLEARVARTTTEGAGLQFVDNSPPSVEVLGALLTPTWDGENLLDGVARQVGDHTYPLDPHEPEAGVLDGRWRIRETGRIRLLASTSSQRMSSASTPST